MQQGIEERTIIVAVFLLKSNLNWHIDFIERKFNVKLESLSLYEIEGDDSDYLITFKLNTNKRIDLRKYFDNATIINIKKGCLFSINGLNKLIEQQSNCDRGNINHKSFNVDWHQYRNKLILSNREGLSIKNIKKIKINDEKML